MRGGFSSWVAIHSHLLRLMISLFLSWAVYLFKLRFGWPRVSIVLPPSALAILPINDPCLKATYKTTKRLPTSTMTADSGVWDRQENIISQKHLLHRPWFTLQWPLTIIPNKLLTQNYLTLALRIWQLLECQATLLKAFSYHPAHYYKSDIILRPTDLTVSNRWLETESRNSQVVKAMPGQGENTHRGTKPWLFIILILFIHYS